MELLKSTITNQEKEACVNLLTDRFYKVGDLDKFLLETKQEDYKKFFEDIVEKAIDRGFSFMVKDSAGKIVGVAINFDVMDEPKIGETGPRSTIYQLEKCFLTPHV